MRPGSEDEEEEPGEIKPIPDLLGGLAPYHIRRLCDNFWEGGFGYTPEEVGNMTLDSAIMLLTDRKYLRQGGRERTIKVKSLQAVGSASSDGTIAGRAADGTPIRGRIRGKSVARQLMEEAEEKRKQQRMSKRQRRAMQRAERRKQRQSKSHQEGAQ